MGLLQMAGAVGGMGAGLSEGLKQMQTGITHMGLQDADRKFQSEKLALQMEHAERLHAQTEAGQERRLDRQLGAHATEAAKGREHDEVMKGLDITSRESTAEIDRNARSADVDKQIGANKDIAKGHDEVTERIHNADRLLKEKEINKNFEAATQTAKVKAVTEVGNEITRLSVILKDPMLDKNSPEYKNLAERMSRLVKLHDSYTRSLNLGAKEEAVEPAKERPAFKNQLATPPKSAPGKATAPTVTPKVPGGLFDTVEPGLYDPKTSSMMQDLQ